VLSVLTTEPVSPIGMYAIVQENVLNVVSTESPILVHTLSIALQ
jgi:hypothetical protein